MLIYLETHKLFHKWTHRTSFWLKMSLLNVMFCLLLQNNLRKDDLMEGRLKILFHGKPDWTVNTVSLFWFDVVPFKKSSMFSALFRLRDVCDVSLWALGYWRQKQSWIPVYLLSMMQKINTEPWAVCAFLLFWKGSKQHSKLELLSQSHDVGDADGFQRCDHRTVSVSVSISSGAVFEPPLDSLHLGSCQLWLTPVFMDLGLWPCSCAARIEVVLQASIFQRTGRIWWCPSHLLSADNTFHGWAECLKIFHPLCSAACSLQFIPGGHFPDVFKNTSFLNFGMWLRGAIISPRPLALLLALCQSFIFASVLQPDPQSSSAYRSAL